MMIRMKTILIFWITCYLASCTNLDHASNQGLYKYVLYQCMSPNSSDTVYTTVTLNSIQSVDNVKMMVDLAGYIIGTNDAILGVWSVDSIKGELMSDSYVLYSSKLKTGDSWSLDEELKYSKPHTPTSFYCLSVDTTIETHCGVVTNITLIEKRETLDVGHMKKITEYGFDKSGRITMKRVYHEADGRIVNHDCYELSLIDFKPIARFDSTLFETWISYNTAYVKMLVFGIMPDSIIKKAPPSPRM